MAVFEDRFGLPLTAASDQAVAAYQAGVDHLLSLTLGAPEALEQALALDPEFALARIAYARSLHMEARGREARSEAQRARELAAGLGPRERRHVEIIALGIEARGQQALALLEEHLETAPTDALPLSLALGVYGIISFSGIRDHHQVQLALIERLAPRWFEDWWFLGYHGWSLVEVGRPAEALALLDRAFELNPASAMTAHGKAHASYELGDPRGGAEFIDAWLPGYDPASALHCHVAWHRALFALQLGDAQQALAIYEQSVRPPVARSVPMFTLIDAASFLWRAALHGHPLSADRREEVAAFAREHFPQGGLPFLELHVALAYAATAGGEALDALIAAQRERLCAGTLPQGEVVPALCAALGAYAGGDPGSAAEQLAAVAADLPRIGGSNAQRDVFVQTELDAWRRAGRLDEAAAVIDRSLEARAGHLGVLWRARLDGHPPLTPVG